MLRAIIASMLRGGLFLRRDLLPRLLRRWSLVAQTVWSPQRLPITSADGLDGLTSRPDAQPPVEPQVAPKESMVSPSFVDTLKEMRPSHETWRRPAPTPFDDLVFFHTELLRGPPGLGATMFGVTKTHNSVCIRIADYPSTQTSGSKTGAIPGMSWLRIPAATYVHLSDPEKVSYCQLEVTASWSDIAPHELDDPPPPPLRVLSFDLECLGRDRIFPDPEFDPIIQIGNVVSLLGDSSPFIRNIFTLGTCSDIAGASVIPFEDEASLLQRWSEFVKEVDPDLVIGYNTSGFDLQYLLGRAKVLQLPQFAFLGRLIDTATTRSRQVSYTSSRGSPRRWEDFLLPGRLQLDLMHYVRWEAGPKDRRGMSLNAVAERVLGERKEDVHFTAIRGLQTGSADTRRELAVYCLKDAYLPLRLLEVLGCVARYTKEVHEKGIQFNSVLSVYDDAQEQERARVAAADQEPTTN
ncbi:ribonuclease H-like domain-containing protein [Mycena filopes]|nr:ribonuclease H-like domain-containing protein [Mycena filopes]